MSRNLFVSILISFFFLSCGNHKAEKKTEKVKDTAGIKSTAAPAIKSGLKYGIELKKGTRNTFVEYTAKNGDTMLYCSYKGKIEIADTSDKIRHQVIDLRLEYMADKVFIVPRDDHKWLIVYQETDHEGLKSNVALYSAGAAKPEWKITYRVPNPGKPVVDGDVAYISTLGVVAKVSLTNGTVLWQHDSLFNQNNLSYQRLEKAIVYPDKVIFVDLPIPGRRDYRDSMFLDPESGKRLR